MVHGMKAIISMYIYEGVAQVVINEGKYTVFN
jgi:hypothetical protein